MSEAQKSSVIWIFLASVVVLVLGGMAIVTWYFATENVGNTLQRRIVRLQQDMETSVLPCLDAGRTSTHMSARKFEGVQRVLMNAATARFEDDRAMLASGGPVALGLHRAHPEIDSTAANALASVVADCRKMIDNKQQRLRVAVGAFDAWRHEGDLLGVRGHFPTKELQAIDHRSGRLVSAHEALEALSFVVPHETAANAGLMPAQSTLRNNK